MHFNYLIRIIVKMFSAFYLNKKFNQISRMDIISFLNGFTRFGHKTDISSEIINILFGKIHENLHVYVGIVTNLLSVSGNRHGNYVSINSSKSKNTFNEIHSLRVTYHLRCTQFKSFILKIFSAFI